MNERKTEKLQFSQFLDISLTINEQISFEFAT